MVDVEQERKDRAESRRLTQLVLNVEAEPWDLPAVAHWVHTGEALRDQPVVNSRGAVSDGAATWTPGGVE